MNKIDTLKAKMQSNEPLDRDEVRAVYDGSIPDFNQACELRDMINRQILDDALMDGTYHMHHHSLIRAHKTSVELRCQSYYFDDREAVTFNGDGFVGFAGWADRYNVQPILRGFVLWAEARAVGAQEVGE